MSNHGKYKSDAFEAIHSAVTGMYEAGTIDETTLKRFDQSCLNTLSIPPKTEDQT